MALRSASRSQTATQTRETVNHEEVLWNPNAGSNLAFRHHRPGPKHQQQHHERSFDERQFAFVETQTSTAASSSLASTQFKARKRE
jgi:hypothetical protein